MNIDFNKSQNGLIPVIVQDDQTLQVLMLGYMNAEAFEKTQQEKVVTFFSRSKNRLWTKGEESGNFLTVKSIAIDCDQDTILIKAVPEKVVCHTGSFSCFGNKDSKGFLYELEEKIIERIDQKTEGSYTYSLFQRGINKMAQKVGEEAVELVIEAKDDNGNLFKNEAADLLYHFLILLKAKNCSLQDIEGVLMSRNQ
ncbi:bifunctional phosphoribosyl-AMP cyclohydrolase/phosphoribosyl-ATP diphosphatase HisIE [Chryseobacterium sp. SN22]|uniref:bifunctional phosphoribosyl-AMP cyclohydrolase/phosphoribosyl-ATP diphosphatase HisIE n=1 Tax=Chryseobacterium sp. SN22 TaxID=2606431 RepID=UPI0011EE92E2|nr:bifunctional phosphoribosyl-AMP cyclohydrolase/phosphoribosyl-ATP diphosphatase HisIE [Chryseobacterium sp. SN22]KAA0130200.1 bifunctional phosphoribosyl-AMP cyclohydrolase/phosphoribosyl-ATP diphosphatase HisIE [Chryseobacterium sp. SN22]